MEDFNSKYSGPQVEALLDQVASGNAGGGGGGGITVETDPVFSASPAASITEGKKTEWDNKYTKPSGGIPESDLASDVQTSLSKADTSVQKDNFGGIEYIQIQGFEGSLVGKLYALPSEATGDEDDILLSRNSVKTINGESILGSGDITISGGSGEVGPQGPQGDKGDKGDTGVGVQSVKQTTTSNVDSGYNVVTVTLTDGTTSTFSVKNGSKGSTGANGTNGVSVSSVKQTTISSADGGTNVVTVTLSNGTTSTFNVKNGSKGSNGTNGKDGADGEDGATFTPSVDSAGNLSWTNNKGLTNPPTVNIKGPKGDKGDAGSGGGSTGGGKVIASVSADMGGIIFGAMSWPPMSPNTIYVYDSGTILKHLTVYEFEDTSELYAEYSVIFKLEIGSDEDTAQVSLPEYVLWANGVIPQVEAGVTYELSITRTKLRGGEVFNAVLTPFKAV